MNVIVSEERLFLGISTPPPQSINVWFITLQYTIAINHNTIFPAIRGIVLGDVRLHIKSVLQQLASDIAMHKQQVVKVTIFSCKVLEVHVTLSTC